MIYEDLEEETKTQMTFYIILKKSGVIAQHFPGTL